MLYYIKVHEFERFDNSEDHGCVGGTKLAS